MATDEKRGEISAQVRAINSLHQRVVAACWSKCVPKPKDGELTIGEMSCVDRCVPKYLEAHALVGQEMREHRGGKPVDYP
jgi:mitochondrial import inner membrane translocase subunit TIM10